MSGALDAVAGTSSADSEAINNLLAEMQGQGALAAQAEMGNVNQNKIVNPNAVQEEAKGDEISDMERRLAALK